MAGQENVNAYMRNFNKMLLANFAQENMANLEPVVVKEITVNGVSGPLSNAVFLWGASVQACSFCLADDNGVIRLPVNDESAPALAKIDTLDYNEFTVDLSNADPVTVNLTNAS